MIDLTKPTDTVKCNGEELVHRQKLLSDLIVTLSKVTIDELAEHSVEEIVAGFMEQRFINAQAERSVLDGAV
jgi:hypothetical protein